MKQTALLSISLICMLSGCAWYERNIDPTTPAHETGSRARMNVMNAPVSAATAQAIDSTLSSTVQAALRGDPDAIISSLVPEDRDRIGSLSDADRRSLSQVAGQYSSNWNSRYSRVINWDSPSDAHQVFGSYQISQGQEPPYAFVIIPASHGLPKVTLRLRNIGNNTWRINAPDALTATALNDRLHATLNDLAATSNNWPADENESARIAAHRILEMFSRT